MFTPHLAQECSVITYPVWPVTPPPCIPVIVQNDMISDRNVVEIGKDLFDSGFGQIMPVATG